MILLRQNHPSKSTSTECFQYAILVISGFIFVIVPFYAGIGLNYGAFHLSLLEALILIFKGLHLFGLK